MCARGLVAIISVKLPEPQFESQTKDKLLNLEVESFVQQAVNEKLGSYFEENPKEATVHFRKGHVGGRGARGGAQGARADPPQKQPRRQQPSRQAGRLPQQVQRRRPKFSWSRAIPPAAAPSRAAIPISRRSFLSSEKSSTSRRPTPSRLFRHEAIRTIISALGCGFREDFNLEKRRYGKVVIMTDADVDGSHIRTLLLTFFFRHMQELIRAGRIYVAQPPLYQIAPEEKERIRPQRAVDAKGPDRSGPGRDAAGHPRR